MDPYAPSDSGLAKRLSFSPSPKASEKKRLEQWGNGDSTGKRSSPFHPHQSPTRRDPLHSSGTDLCDHHPPPSPPRPFPRRQKARRRSGVGFCGALIFLFLCLAALALIVRFNSWHWHTISSKAVYKFFSNEPLRRNVSRDRLATFHFYGRHFAGLGALQVAVLLGVVCAIFTCFFTFYDSNIPGNVPPTPVSPRNRRYSSAPQSSSNWHLGYIFVPVNCMVTFSLALFFLRWDMGLPFI